MLIGNKSLVAFKVIVLKEEVWGGICGVKDENIGLT